MKKLIFILLISIITSCAAKQTYLDETGKEISEKEYNVLRENKDAPVTVWYYKAPDSGRVSQIVGPKYSPLIVKYPLFKEKLEAKTGRTFGPGTIFLLDYTYLNDLCSDKSTNNWNKAVIKLRKEFTTPNKEQIEAEYKNVVMLKFFEQGILLENEPTSAEEYYFTDDNFLRKNFFRHPSFCGSFALIKPDGTTLVRNGEYTAKMMVEHLQPAIWEKIFTE